MVMQTIWRYFKVQLPGYLKSLPLPRTFGGFYDLTRSEWLELVPFILFLITFLYIIVSPFVNFLTQLKKPRPRINRKQRMSENKVVDSFDIEDLGDKTAFCRCWRSSKERIQRFLYLGDDRNILKVFVAGKEVTQENPTNSAPPTSHLSLAMGVVILAAAKLLM